jgi:hypothetical protein
MAQQEVSMADKFLESVASASARQRRRFGKLVVLPILTASAVCFLLAPHAGVCACPPVGQEEPYTVEQANGIRFGPVWPDCCCIDNDISITDYDESNCQTGCCGAMTPNCRTCVVTWDAVGTPVLRDGFRNRVDLSGVVYQTMPAHFEGILCMCNGGY